MDNIENVVALGKSVICHLKFISESNIESLSGSSRMN